MSQFCQSALWWHKSRTTVAYCWVIDTNGERCVLCGNGSKMLHWCRELGVDHKWGGEVMGYVGGGTERFVCEGEGGSGGCNLHPDPIPKTPPSNAS